jgi:hypothetical protein
MPRFMIELPHENEFHTCSRALAAIEETGSHFVTNAEWGCDAGVHVGWLVIELEDRAQALQLVPPQLRTMARVVELSRITKEDIRARIRAQQGTPEPVGAVEGEPVAAAPEPPPRRLLSRRAKRRAS